MEIAVAKGKKFHDKRESERAKEMQAEAKAAMARRNSSEQGKQENMKISITTSAKQATWQCRCAGGDLFRSRGWRALPTLRRRGQDGWLAEMRASGEFTGKLYESATLHRPKAIPAKRLVVIGGGKASTFSTVESRRIAACWCRALKRKA